MAEKPLLKTYKVLKRIGWESKVYLPDETIVMAEEWAAFYVANEVLTQTNTKNQNLAKKEGE